MRVAAGIALLGLAASCGQWPGARERYSVTLDIPPSPATLLRRMALDVPRDVLRALPADLTGVSFPTPVGAAPAFDALSASSSPDDAGRAVDCLTAAVYYEARSQSDDGQKAVAQVVLNRVRDRAFPNSVCGVVYQGSQRATGCQFSFTCDGSMAFRRDPASWEHAREIAIGALSGDVYAPVGSSTFYHADYVLPWWASSMDKVVQVGAHIFYRWRGRLEGALAFRQAYAGTEPSLTGRVIRAAAAPTVANGGQSFGETQVMGSVRIHRVAPAPAVAVTAAAAAAPAERPATPGGDMARASITTVAGVRIHRGGAPVAAAAPATGGITLND